MLYLVVVLFKKCFWMLEFTVFTIKAQGRVQGCESFFKKLPQRNWFCWKRTFTVISQGDIQCILTSNVEKSTSTMTDAPWKCKIIVSGTFLHLYNTLLNSQWQAVLKLLKFLYSHYLGTSLKVRAVKERERESSIVRVNLRKGSVEWKIGSDVHLRYTLWGFSLDQCLSGMSSLTFPVRLENVLGFCQCHSTVRFFCFPWHTVALVILLILIYFTFTLLSNATCSLSCLLTFDYAFLVKSNPWPRCC